jgi:hypothetical protein
VKNKGQITLVVINVFFFILNRSYLNFLLKKRMQQNLLTNYNDFWTSNSDSSDSQDDASHTSDSRSDTVIEPGRESMEDIASRWLEDEDVTFNKEFSSQPRMIPEPTITPPKPNMIRKRWAVYDDSPIDNFSEVMTDMAMT